MSQVYRTLRVAPSDKGVLSVIIDAPPMNLIGPELVHDLVGLYSLIFGVSEIMLGAELHRSGKDLHSIMQDDARPENAHPASSA